MDNQTVNQFLVIPLTCSNCQTVAICSCATFYWLVKNVEDVLDFISKFGRQHCLCYVLTTLSLNDEIKG